MDNASNTAALATAVLAVWSSLQAAGVPLGVPLEIGLTWVFMNVHDYSNNEVPKYQNGSD